MKKLIFISFIVFVFLVALSFKTYSQSTDDVEDLIKIIIEKGTKKIKDEITAEPIKLELTNGLRGNIVVEVKVTADNKSGSKVFKLLSGDTKTYEETGVGKDNTVKVIVNFKIIRQTEEGERYTLRSYNKEFTFYHSDRTETYTVNEWEAGKYDPTGETAIMFINHLPSLVTVTGSNKGREFAENIAPDKSFVVYFRNDDVPSTKVVIEEWIEDNGTMIVKQSKEKDIYLQNILFDSYIIDENFMKW